METYSPGEIVLLAFPFTDANTARRRPALVLVDTGDNDIVVARVTSQIGRDLFDVQLLEWEAAGLLLPSIVRIHKLATLEKVLAERRMGTLDSGDWERVRESIQRLWMSL